MNSSTLTDRARTIFSIKCYVQALCQSTRWYMIWYVDRFSDEWRCEQTWVSKQLHSRSRLLSRIDGDWINQEMDISYLGLFENRYYPHGPWPLKQVYWWLSSEWNGVQHPIFRQMPFFPGNELATYRSFQL